jgi:hypothetical protein
LKHSLFLVALMAFSPALRADLVFTSILLGANEVPPTGSLATGFITVDLHNDLNTLDVDETFNNLTAAASAAHIHCCAPPGANAPVVLPFPGFPASTSGTYIHTFNLSTDLTTGITPAAFVAALEGGDTYANIHNIPFPGGEIRGWLTPVPEPSSLVLFAGCLATLGVVRRFRRRNG